MTTFSDDEKLNFLTLEKTDEASASLVRSTLLDREQT